MGRAMQRVATASSAEAAACRGAAAGRGSCKSEGALQRMAVQTECRTGQTAIPKRCVAPFADESAAASAQQSSRPSDCAQSSNTCDGVGAGDRGKEAWSGGSAAGDGEDGSHVLAVPVLIGCESMTWMGLVACPASEITVLMAKELVPPRRR